jgi:hypothetical protein
MALAKWRLRGGLGLILGAALILVLGWLPLPALAQDYQVELVVEDVYLPWSLNFRRMGGCCSPAVTPASSTRWT